MEFAAVKKTIAGPTLRALAAAAVDRLLIQLDDGSGLADYSRSGTLRDEISGVTLTTSNVITVEPPAVASKLTWEIIHPRWVLTFTERRMLGDGGNFTKSGPQQLWLEGDLVEAARFLDIPRELFLEALRADGFRHSAIVIEKLRWLNVAYVRDPQSLRVVMQSL